MHLVVTLTALRCQMESGVCQVNQILISSVTVASFIASQLNVYLTLEGPRLFMYFQPMGESRYKRLRCSSGRYATLGAHAFPRLLGSTVLVGQMPLRMRSSQAQPALARNDIVCQRVGLHVHMCPSPFHCRACARRTLRQRGSSEVTRWRHFYSLRAVTV